MGHAVTLEATGLVIMTTEIIIAIISMLGGGGLVAWYVAIKKTPADIKKTNSEEKVNLIAGANAALDLMQKVVKFADEENADLVTRIESLEKTQQANAEERVKRDKRIEELENTIEQLNRDYAKAMADVQAKYDKSKSAIQKLVKALQDANIPVPEINGDLSESVHKWKWPTQ